MPVLLLVLVVVASAGLAGCGGDGDPVDDVRAGYERYVTAVTVKDGATAAGSVTTSTLDHYADLRDLALTADRAELGRERIVDQLAVLGLRAGVRADVLRTGDPRGVVSAAVENQVITAGGASVSSLEDVQVTGDAATATVGAAAGAKVQFWFRREGGDWKVDLTALLTPAEESLQSARKRLEEPVGDMLTRVMSKRVGAARARALWTPLDRGAGRRPSAKP